MANFRHKKFKRMEITPGKEERWRRRNFSAHSLSQREETKKGDKRSVTGPRRSAHTPRQHVPRTYLTYIRKEERKGGSPTRSTQFRVPTHLPHHCLFFFLSFSTSEISQAGRASQERVSNFLLTRYTFFENSHQISYFSFSKQ